MPSQANLADRLRHWREPIATVVLLWVMINFVISIVTIVLRAQTISLPDAMRSVGGTGMGILSVVCLIAATGACTLINPVTKHARLIAIFATVLVLVGGVASLANAIGAMIAGNAGALGGFFEAFGALTDVAIKALAVFVLWQFAQRGAREETPSTAPARNPEPAPQDARQRPDPTQGAGWHSASEAARQWSANQPTAQPSSSQPAGPSQPSAAQSNAPESDPVWGAAPLPDESAPGAPVSDPVWGAAPLPEQPTRHGSGQPSGGQAGQAPGSGQPGGTPWQAPPYPGGPAASASRDLWRRPQPGQGEQR